MMLSILAMASALAFNLASNSSCLALLAGLIIPCNHSLLVYLSSWNFLGVGGNKSWIPNFLASLNKSADLLRENFALCQLPDSWFLFGKNGFLNGSVVVDGPSLYCANGRGGYLMKKLCNFWGSLANASLGVSWKDMVWLLFGVCLFFLEKNFSYFLFDYKLGSTIDFYIYSGPSIKHLTAPLPPLTKS